MGKRILAAGIVRDIEFGSLSELDRYLSVMKRMMKNFKCLDQFNRADGTVVVRILTQYNDTDLIELYE